MASIKTDTEQIKRSPLNTTIRKDILDAFKVSCKESGINMNVILETFMEQFNSGEFVLKFGKANKLNVDLTSGDESEEVIEETIE